jgi:hypothetical protein
LSCDTLSVSKPKCQHLLGCSLIVACKLLVSLQNIPFPKGFKMPISAPWCTLHWDIARCGRAGGIVSFTHVATHNRLDPTSPPLLTAPSPKPPPPASPVGGGTGDLHAGFGVKRKFKKCYEFTGQPKSKPRPDVCCKPRASSESGLRSLPHKTSIFLFVASLPCVGSL